MTPTGGCALVALAGTEISPDLAVLLADPRVAGVTVYGLAGGNGRAETIRLIETLRSAAGRPLLLAVDQEGGQLNAAGSDTTPFAGNLALGAVGDVDLARRVGTATGLELRALGFNVNYAPVADIASQPDNPSLGIRSFGSDPTQVAALTAAMVEGLQTAGVAATLKHFPGKGEAKVDPHYQLPVLDLDRHRLEAVEFAPFRAGIEAGARLVMIGHYGLPAVTGQPDLPASVSPRVMDDLLRQQLGFDGVIVTDALDMGGFGRHPLEAPLSAGADLLLYGPAQAGLLPTHCPSSGTRLSDLLAWVEAFPRIDPEVIGCADHLELAAELGRRSITLVRDEAELLPIRLDPGSRVLVVMPTPTNLTPADVSAGVVPGLASAWRRYHYSVTEIVTDFSPEAADVAAVMAAASAHDLVMVGTIEATPGQASLVSEFVRRWQSGSGPPVVVAALRTPYDLARFPEAPAYLAAYGIYPPTLEALVDAVLGRTGTSGRLPVPIPGLYPAGHGITLQRTVTQ